jgi:hypothetical protein
LFNPKILQWGKTLSNKFALYYLVNAPFKALNHPENYSLELFGVCNSSRSLKNVFLTMLVKKSILLMAIFVAGKR